VAMVVCAVLHSAALKRRPARAWLYHQ
jgi:hypothetical protein